MLEARVGNLAEEIAAGLVGEVSCAAEDALFIDHGPWRSVDHGGLMVRLDIEVVAVAQFVADQGGDKAKVSAEAKFETIDADGEGDGVERIVLDAEGVDLQIAE